MATMRSHTIGRFELGLDAAFSSRFLSVALLSAKIGPKVATCASLTIGTGRKFISKVRIVFLY